MYDTGEKWFHIATEGNPLGNMYFRPIIAFCTYVAFMKMTPFPDRPTAARTSYSQ